MENSVLIMMFINCHNNHDRQKDSIMLPVKKKTKQKKKQKGSWEKSQIRNWCGGMLSEMYHSVKCGLRSRRNTHSIKSIQNMKKKSSILHVDPSKAI